MIGLAPIGEWELSLNYANPPEDAAIRDRFKDGEIEDVLSWSLYAANPPNGRSSGGAATTGRLPLLCVGACLLPGSSCNDDDGTLDQVVDAVTAAKYEFPPRPDVQGIDEH